MILVCLRYSVVLFEHTGYSDAKQNVLSVQFSSLIHLGTVRDLFVLP